MSFGCKEARLVSRRFLLRGYVKRPVHLFDRGRGEELSFHIEPDELAALAGEPELVLKAGSATVRLDERRMARLRALVKQMTVPGEGAR